MDILEILKTLFALGIVYTAFFVAPTWKTKPQTNPDEELGKAARKYFALLNKSLK